MKPDSDTTQAILPANQVMRRRGLLPRRFVAPSVTWLGEYIIRPLSIEDSDVDYDCYMSCVDYIRDGGFIQPPGAPFVDWPRQDQPRRWSTVLLGHAEYQLAAGEAVEYGIFNLSNTEEYGCLYIRRSLHPEFAADVTFWIRASHEAELDAPFLAFIQDWIPKVYPFQRPVGFPGRTQSWETWLDRPERPDVPHQYPASQDPVSTRLRTGRETATDRSSQSTIKGTQNE